MLGMPLSRSYVFRFEAYGLEENQELTRYVMTKARTYRIKAEKTKYFACERVILSPNTIKYQVTIYKFIPFS